jgi:hypothetical protein
MTEPVSKSKLFLARLVIFLMAAFLIAGVVLYGISGEVLARVWQNLVDRPGGPMVFRFILQPVMATIAAYIDGVRDARSGRRPFLVTILTDPGKRGGYLQEAVVATARIILLGLIMDGIYQFIQFDAFHPAEAVIISLLLAFLPYVVMRGLIARVARRWFSHPSTGDSR